MPGGHGTDEATGRPLRDVYSVTLGVALALAVGQVIDVERRSNPIQANAILPFVAFLMLAFTLYHWAVRFVDIAHSDNDEQSGAAIVASLVIGSTELIVVLALAVLVSRPDVFLTAFAAALGFEVVAGVALLKTRAYGRLSRFGRRYLLLNSLTFLAATLSAVTILTLDLSGEVAGLAAVAVSSVRGFAFYRSGFAVLFGARTSST